MAWPDRVAIAFCIAAAAFLVRGAFGPVQREQVRVSAIAPIDTNEPAISGTGFQANAVYTSTPPPSYKGTLNLYGSWLGTDTSTGAAQTAWYPAVPDFSVFVAGYPNHPGNKLFAEVSTRESKVLRIPISPNHDVGEMWFVKSVSLRDIPDAAKFRMVAVDGSTTFGGWLGFSQPFVRQPSNAYLLRQLLEILLTTTAALVVLLAPGLLLRQKIRDRLATIWIPVPGLIGSGLLGLIAWLGPRQLAPRAICETSLALLVVYATFRFIRVPLSRYTSGIERRVLLITVVLAAIGVAKATYSVGPVGELFGPVISRTLEVGGHSDSRLPFHAVQLVALRAKPFGSLGKSLYASYGVFNFSHRGALPALSASSIVLASAVRIQPSMPDQQWTLFDPEGFSAYRIAMIAIASCSLVIVFGLARLFLSEKWALLAYLVAVTAPFTIHEIYFTWPKLESGCFALLGAYLVLSGRYFLGGLMVGTGYLCHPLALFSIPALMALVVLKSERCESPKRGLPKKLYLWSLRTGSILAGVAICILLWRHVNRKHFAQGEFLSYFLQAEGPAMSVSHWLTHRFNSFCNTFVPLFLFIFHRNHEGINSVEGLSPAPVQFYGQYWCAVPFGAGIAYFFCLLRLLYIALLRFRFWLFFVFGLPALLFTVYWGAESSGLLKNGLHAWFLGLLIFSVVIWQRSSNVSQRFWKICNWSLALRGLEIVLMLLLPAIWSQHKAVDPVFALSDILALFAMVVMGFGICIYTFTVAEDLRKCAYRDSL